MNEIIDKIPEECGGDAYSNFDHILTIQEKEIKKSGKYYYHNALEFNAVLWWDKKKKRFIEIVSRHHIPVAQYEDKKLMDIIKKANDEYGNG